MQECISNPSKLKYRYNINDLRVWLPKDPNLQGNQTGPMRPRLVAETPQPPEAPLRESNWKGDDLK